MREKFPIAYGVRTNSKNILTTSSSGGIFSEIANFFINNGGVVYGCILDKNLKATYYRGTKIEDILKMRTSKYVQCDIKGIKERVKDDLEKKIEVLFVGPPCYINYIKKDLIDLEKDYLTTVDFICHGTPNPIIFSDHVKYLEKIYNKKATTYSFRDKRFGWTHDEFIKFENGEKKSSIKEVGRYKRIFYLNYSLNSGCFSCKYTSKKRVSDLTIGDFWGVEKILKIYDNKGMSALLINTQKGLDIFKKIVNNLEIYKVELKDFKHGPLHHPTIKPEKYDEFWRDYKKYGYKYATDKYAPITKKEIFSTYRRRIVHILYLDKIMFYIQYKLREIIKNDK